MILDNENVCCDVIIAHHNYSEYIDTAIKSVTNQTHRKFECLIVDDASSDEHYSRLLRIVSDIGDPRIRVHRLQENQGQIFSFYQGLERTGSEFISFLDPDDFYEPTFLEELIHAHLNPLNVAAVATCDMGLFRTGNGKLASHYIRSLDNSDFEKRNKRQLHQQAYGYAEYFPPWKAGWLWATTSALMIRRDALELIQPNNFVPETKAFGDTYCAQGAHLIGGTLYLDRVLSWRGLHENNTVESDRLFSKYQKRQRDDFDEICRNLKWAAFKSFILNGGADHLTPANFGEIVTSHFPSELIYEFAIENSEFATMLLKYSANVLK